MRIVQSLWFCNNTDFLRFKAGWISSEYHLMSWALSSLQLKKFYNEVALYTDTIGAKLLIDMLKLPYTEVAVDLDCLNSIHPQLWAIPKIHTYSKQEKPFLHIDGDVFIWKKFSDRIENADLVAQNIEVSTNYYQLMLQNLDSQSFNFPIEMLSNRNENEGIYTYNAGILGGKDLEFYKRYANIALEFVNNNTNKFHKIDVSGFNILFEQYLFYCLTKSGNKKVEVLLDEVIEASKYKRFGDFIEVPHNKHYLHLLGDYKRIESVCMQMSNRLREDYPEYYYRIIALFKSEKVSLLKDYYWFDHHHTENALVLRHNSLKEEYTNGRISAKGKVDEDRHKSQESVYWRSSFIERMIETSGANHSPEYLADLNKFEDALWHIVKTKFSDISEGYLLARDICCTSYPEYIFGDSKIIHNKRIVADDLIEKIESQFDWLAIIDSNGSINSTKLNETEPSEIFTFVIPECDSQGYSLSNIDELDWLILGTIKEAKTIGELFDEIKFAFDASDLESSKAEFEELIFGRIKKGLLNKSIKAVIPPKGDI